MVWFKNQEKIKGYIKNTFSLLSLVVSIYCATKYTKECSQGVLNGITFCITVLVPSLFLFMVIASYITNSKVSLILSRIFGNVVEKLFNLPRVCSSTVILSLIGGYPIGAKCTQSLYDSGNISKDQAKKLSIIAVCSGPGFVLNYVGVALLNSKRAGVILLVSQVIAFFSVAIMCGKLLKVKNENVIPKNQDSSSNLVDAVLSACKGTVSMCAMVILFSAIISICDVVFSNHATVKDIIACVCEVTTACHITSTKYPLYITSFVIGFSGISVHFQIFSQLKNIGINKTLFFLFRIIQGIISGAATYILLIPFPVTIDVFSSVNETSSAFASSVAGSFALILTAVCFLNSINNTKFLRR